MNAIVTIGLRHLKDIWQDNHIGESIMENSEEIMARLKFIGHIQREEKINTKYVSRHPNNMATRFWRTVLYSDNRTNALKFVKDVIARSLEIIELQHNDLVMCRSIVSDLIKAKQGITNLKYTYNEDTKFCCDMDVVIENIASQLTNIKEKYPDLFENLESKTQPKP